MNRSWLVLILIALIAAFAAALIALIVAGRRGRIPWRWVRYDDAARRGRKPERTYYDAETGLSGKPDFIIDGWGTSTPIEVKSGRTPDSPYPGHVMQLAAYCYLIERCDRRSVRRGILRYPETSFEISYTIELRRRLLATLEALRKAEAEGYPRTHRDFTKCRGCGYRSHCDERLRS